MDKSVTATPWSTSQSCTPMAQNPPTIDIVCLIHRKTVWSRKMKDGKPEGRFCHPLQGGNSWTQHRTTSVAHYQSWKIKSCKAELVPVMGRTYDVIRHGWRVHDEQDEEEGGLIHRSDCWVPVHIFIHTLMHNSDAMVARSSTMHLALLR